MNRSKRYSPKIRERAVRMVFEPQSEYESEWAAMCSISGKIGCTAMRPPDDHLMRSIVDDYLHSNPVSDHDQLGFLHRHFCKMKFRTSKNVGISL